MSPRPVYRALVGAAVLGCLPHQLATAPAQAVDGTHAVHAPSVMAPQGTVPSMHHPAGTHGASYRPTHMAAQPRSTANYVVKKGDTLSSIARAHNTTVTALSKANNLPNPNHILVGETLTIPQQSHSPAVPNTFLGRTYPEPVVTAANKNKASLDALPLPDRAASRALVARTARQMGVDPSLALAISYQESGFNARAVSPANAIGLMQVIPSSGKWAGQLVGRPLNLLKPEDNVTAGVALIRQLLRTADNTDQAIAGYYQGLASVRKNGMFADTQQYVAAVKAHQQRFR